MGIQGTPDGDLVSLLECGSYIYNSWSKVRETSGMMEKLNISKKSEHFMCKRY